MHDQVTFVHSRHQVAWRIAHIRMDRFEAASSEQTRQIRQPCRSQARVWALGLFTMAVNA